jgi:hypothetical protein
VATALKITDFHRFGTGRFRKRKSATSTTIRRKNTPKISSNITVFFNYNLWQ